MELGAGDHRLGSISLIEIHAENSSFSLTTQQSFSIYYNLFGLIVRFHLIC